MALPPEDIEDLIEASTSIVVAKVVAVVHQGEEPEIRKGVGGQEGPTQNVKLQIEKYLQGDQLEDSPVLHKPGFNYILDTDDEGVFFLREGIILGRYGNRIYSEEETVEALKTSSPSLV